MKLTEKQVDKIMEAIEDGLGYDLSQDEKSSIRSSIHNIEEDIYER